MPVLDYPPDVNADFHWILYASRDDIPSKRQKFTEAKGDLSNITETVPTGQEDVKATAEKELGVDEDDGFNEENNKPLSE